MVIDVGCVSRYSCWMANRPKILASAQAQYPKSANKTVRVVNAWRREDSTFDVPATNGDDGWSPVGQLATYEVLRDLQDRGFTVVNLSTGGVAWGFRDVAISNLI